MIRLYNLLFLFVTVAFVQCERSVVIETPYPDKAVYCEMPDQLIGRWQSDSVWLVTQSDSLDSTLVNTRPTFFYTLNIACDADTQFLLEYTNFSGVKTREFYSENFVFTDSVIQLYSELDFERSNADSFDNVFYQSITDSTIFLRYGQQLNADQVNEISVWLKRQI